MKTIKFIEKSKIWFIIALTLMTLSIGSLLFQGLNFGIDFRGGTIVAINLHKTFETQNVRHITDKYDTSADITNAGEAKEEIIISTKESLNEAQRKELFDSFKKEYKLADTDLISVDTVTATIGKEIAVNALLACLVVVALMLVYITFRFEFYFGISAILALVFDIIIVVGVYSLFQISVNAPFIAAILTILGYSINDTIVVFDRIRENEVIMGFKDINNLANLSINQTLRRSINTVATTLIAVVCLYIFGVAAIKDFALPLIVGIASGCYSSIFIASPLWVLFQKKFPNTKLAGRKKSKIAATRSR